MSLRSWHQQAALEDEGFAYSDIGKLAVATKRAVEEAHEEHERNLANARHNRRQLMAGLAIVLIWTATFALIGRLA